uniref:Uncharacterized protein n=1 Tax=Rhizophora mucronata TaxID=61149 RepID=A0A2P2R2G3_RHIMU
MSTINAEIQKQEKGGIQSPHPSIHHNNRKIKGHLCKEDILNTKVTALCSSLYFPAGP